MCSSQGLPHNLGFLVKCDEPHAACEACVERLCQWLNEEPAE